MRFEASPTRRVFASSSRAIVRCASGRVSPEPATARTTSSGVQSDARRDLRRAGAIRSPRAARSETGKIPWSRSPQTGTAPQRLGRRRASPALATPSRSRSENAIARLISCTRRNNKSIAPPARATRIAPSCAPTRERAARRVFQFATAFVRQSSNLTKGGSRQIYSASSEHPRRTAPGARPSSSKLPSS